MKKYFMAFVMGASLLTLAACGGGGEDQETTTGGGEFTMVENDEAQSLYKQSCIGCHGGNMESGSGPNLQKVGSKYSEDEIKNIILNGKGSMPVVINDDAEAATLAGWLAEHK
ncbi:cytochrome c551 [Sutcliffiella rhizosphaerae]|uniref:Cytochrome c-551 n=1 Tax=Sutcliffiella rhizosphaerae TaxID=2880967 RepID=A0ABN8A8K9_9BACI|nr:cytochrome c [Sutcliffiella rhizosphaerae]CAG9621448.1 Cytochrome c-551 [Sutcliffiella rhizosphaerae]